MPKTDTTAKSSSSKSSYTKAKSRSGPFRFRDPAETAEREEPLVHVFKIGENDTQVVCDTDSRGHATPGGQSLSEIVINSSEGFIPLWARDTTLRWRFNKASMLVFENPTSAKNEIRKLLGRALMEWGDAVPVKFAEREDAWDFEIVMRKDEKCDINGCVLASAFFPDSGRHQLKLYPTMFEQTPTEQVETLIHEIGHTFGLRHFFANVKEVLAPSEIFGVHDEFSIMNYGAKSVLTDNDRSDLKRLYQSAWSGELTKINGTPIQFVNPFHTVGESPENLTAMTALDTIFKLRSCPA